MRIERLIMGMPSRVELIGATREEPLEAIFDLWESINDRFSTYKESSEIMRINRGEIPQESYSAPMQEILSLAEETKTQTYGFFDIQRHDGMLDPSGLVKGWAIQKGAQRAQEMGFDNYYLEIGGDIQTRGSDEAGRAWSIGIRNPFDHEQIIKVLYPRGAGVATSGSAARGNHIYDPHDPDALLSDVVSITVIGPNVYEADRFATAAFAMGERGIHFINTLKDFEAYAIDTNGMATLTDGISMYVHL